MNASEVTAALAVFFLILGLILTAQRVLLAALAKNSLARVLAEDDRLFDLVMGQLRNIRAESGFEYARVSYVAGFLSTAVAKLSGRLQKYANAGLGQKSELAVANYVLAVLRRASKQRATHPTDGQFVDPNTRSQEASSESAPEEKGHAQGATG